MLTKTAVIEPLAAFLQNGQEGSPLEAFRKVAKRQGVGADPSKWGIEPEPGMLYISAAFISSRVNANYDGFPPEELEASYRTFVGKPFFVDHTNKDHKRTRGVILDSKLHKGALKNGAPDWWVEGLIEFDALTFPRLAEKILSGDLDAVSMGVNCRFIRCSVCDKKAEDPSQFCEHVRFAKGRHVRIIDEKTGATTEKLVFEKCFGLGFFEISGVFDPADESADILDLYVADKQVTSRRISRNLIGPGESIDNYHDRINNFAKTARTAADPTEVILALPADINEKRGLEPCPRCGQMWDGMICDQCGFEQPPVEFEDPDFQAPQLEPDQIPGEQIPGEQVPGEEGQLGPRDEEGAQPFDENGMPVQKPKVDEEGNPIEEDEELVDEEGRPIKLDENGKPIPPKDIPMDKKPFDKEQPFDQEKAVKPKVDEDGKPIEEQPFEVEKKVEVEKKGPGEEEELKVKEKAKPPWAKDMLPEEQGREPVEKPKPFDKKKPFEKSEEPSSQKPEPSEKAKPPRSWDEKDEKKPPFFKKRKKGSVSRFQEMLAEHHQRVADGGTLETTAPYGETTTETPVPGPNSQLPDADEERQAPGEADVQSQETPEVSGPLGQSEVDVPSENEALSKKRQEWIAKRRDQLAKRRAEAFRQAKREHLEELRRKGEEVQTTDVENLDSNPITQEELKAPVTTDVEAPSQNIDEQLNKADSPDQVNDGSETTQTPGEPGDKTNPFQDVQPYKSKVLKALSLVEDREALGLSDKGKRMAEVARFENMEDDKFAGYVEAVEEFKKANVRTASKRIEFGNKTASKDEGDESGQFISRLPSPTGIVHTSGSEEQDAISELATL